VERSGGAELRRALGGWREVLSGAWVRQYLGHVAAVVRSRSWRAVLGESWRRWRELQGWKANRRYRRHLAALFASRSIRALQRQLFVAWALAESPAPDTWASLQQTWRMKQVDRVLTWD
jgi:hypothetical protein